MKVQTKTILLLVASFIGIILFFGLSILWSVSNYTHDDFYKLLEIRAFTAAKVHFDSTDNNLPLKDLQETFFSKLPDEQDYFFAITDTSSFSTIAKQLKVPRVFISKIYQQRKADHQRKELFFKGILYQSNGKEYIVIAAAVNNFQVHYYDYLNKTLATTALLALSFSLITAFYLSRNFFKPLKTITEKTKLINSKSLHLRLPLKAEKDALYELSYTINAMLDRIETSFETQNNFISNASHELRTPLTVIIGEADVALSKPRSPEDYQQTLDIIILEAEKLENKIKALLFLAQTGFSNNLQQFEPIRIDQLLYEVRDNLLRINPELKIQFNLELMPENPEKLQVMASYQLLMLAFSNIISNAGKYSNYNPVIVSLGATEKHALIIIKDSGIGIPKEELRFIYDPFFRASNTGNFEGYGIGLPLAQTILRMHQGEIHVSSIEHIGTTVELRIPIPSQAVKR